MKREEGGVVLVESTHADEEERAGELTIAMSPGITGISERN